MTVYFIRVGENGPVKIGWTLRIEKRLRTLQVAHHQPLRVIRKIDGELREERWLHRRYADLRCRGEWYAFTDEMLTIEVPDTVSRERHTLRRGTPEQRAFDKAVSALRPRLLRYAFRLTGTQHDAEDLVQATLTRAFDRWDMFRDGTDLRAWAFTLLHNQYVTFVRRSARRPVVALRDTPIVTQPTQERDFLNKELPRIARRLTAEHRAALFLAADGKSYDEIALICKVPVGTVRSRLSRARQNMRDMIMGGSVSPTVWRILAPDYGRFA